MNTIPTFQPFVQGFMLCASLIIGFGPQNLHLLRQGLRRQHLFATAIVCTLVDLLLISVGVGGLGAAIAASKYLSLAMTLGGTVFLLSSAVRSFRSVWRGQSSAANGLAQSSSLSLKGAILTALSFSLLNPSAYIETVLMIGTTSGHYPMDMRLLFGIGAVTASSFWFFALTYGSSRLAPLFQHRTAWRTLDVTSGCIMLGLAVSLSANQLIG